MLTLTQPETTKRRLGEVLVDGEFISEDDLSRALEAQRATNERLGETLCRLGVLSEMELKAVLASQADLDSAEDVQMAGANVRLRLGDILLKAKRVNPRMLSRALDEQKATNEKLGEVLVRYGALSQAELDAILAWQQDSTKHSATAVKLMLGEILVATDVISRKDLEHALKEQHLTRRQIGEILVESGRVKPNQIAQALKIQSKLFAATLVAVVAAGTLTGCGLSAPSVPGSISLGSGQGMTNGSVIKYDGAVSQTVQSAGGQHSYTDYKNGARIVDNVPFVQQDVHDNTCAQAASTVLLNYWGNPLNYQSVVNEANRFNLGTTPESAKTYLQAKGLQVQAYRNGTLDFVKSLVDQGRPAMVVLDYEGAVHWVVVVGYNDVTSKIILQDSVSGPYTTMTYEKFQKRWQNHTMSNMPIVGGQNYQGLVFDTWR